MSGLSRPCALSAGTPAVRAYLRAAARQRPAVRPLLAIASSVMLLLIAFVA